MSRTLVLTPAQDIAPEPVVWLIPGLVPLGKITALAGAPGLGKSILTTGYAAKVSRAIGDVLIANAEDDPADTIRPRLEAAGANLDRVHLLDVRETTEDGQSVPSIVRLPQDGEAIRKAVYDTAARLVILDPIAALLDGDTNAYREQDVRNALAPLKSLAENQRCAVIVVMHTNKAEGSDPLRRIGNSGAFTALARSVLLFGPDPEDPEGERGPGRILTVVKGNVRETGRGSIAFAIKPATIQSETHGEISTAILEELGESNVSAGDLLGTPEERGAKGEAIAFLRDLLADGPKSAVDVYAAGDIEQISRRTLERAKSSAGVRSVKRGTEGWVWQIDNGAVPGGDLGDLGVLPMDIRGKVGDLPKTDGDLGDLESNIANIANIATPYDGTPRSAIFDDDPVAA